MRCFIFFSIFAIQLLCLTFDCALAENKNLPSEIVEQLIKEDCPFGPWGDDPEKDCLKNIKLKLGVVKIEAKNLEKQFRELEKRMVKLENENKELKRKCNEQSRLISRNEGYQDGFEKANQKLNSEIRILDKKIESMEGLYSGFTDAKNMTLNSPDLNSLVAVFEKIEQSLGKSTSPVTEKPQNDIPLNEKEEVTVNEIKELAEHSIYI